MSVKISEKQANVIYRAWKEGKIEISEHALEMIYYYTEHEFGCRNNCFDMYHSLRNAVGSIIRNELKSAQRSINSFMYSLNDNERLDLLNEKMHEKLKLMQS